MSAQTAFRALVLTAGALLLLLALAGWRALALHDHLRSAHLVVAWCGALVTDLGAGHLTAGLGVRRALIGLIGLAAVGGGGLAGARTWWRTRRFLARLLDRRVPLPADLTRLAHALGMDGRLTLVEVETPLVLCHGLRRPRICLSTGLVDLLTADELRAVLIHERHHLQQRDPSRAAVASVLSGALPLPIVRALRQAYVRARELEADRAAIAVGARGPLVRALEKLVRHGPQQPLAQLAVAGVHGGIGARIDQLASPEREVGPRLGLRPLLGSMVPLALVVWLAWPLSATAHLADVDAGQAAGHRASTTVSTVGCPAEMTACASSCAHDGCSTIGAMPAASPQAASGECGLRVGLGAHRRQ